MTRTEQVLNAMVTAKRAMGDLVFTVQVQRTEDRGLDTSTGKVDIRTSTYTLDGFIGTWDEGEVDGSNVLSTDTKFYAFPSDETINEKDLVTLFNVQHKIKRIVPYRAGLATALTQLQLRA